MTYPRAEEAFQDFAPVTDGACAHFDGRRLGAMGRHRQSFPRPRTRKPSSLPILTARRWKPAVFPTGNLSRCLSNLKLATTIDFFCQFVFAIVISSFLFS